MQKKLIALAVAGLVSVPAFAQSNVTIYGIADMGVAYRSDSAIPANDSQFAVHSGQHSGSRLGFKGTEALGNGLTAGFVLEQGLFMDTGVSAQGGVAFGRQSFVTLGGNFGTVALGRQYTPQHLMMASFDPFGQGTVGQNVNIWGAGTATPAGGPASASANAYTTRLDNLVAYISPTFAGFNVIAGFSSNAAGQETVGNDGDVQVWAINPNYKNGPIAAGLNYHEIRAKGTVPAVEYRVFDLAASYDFGVAKLAAAYGQNELDGAADKTKKFMVGATVPVSANGSLLASYNQAKFDNDKAKQWAVGYNHNLSKRTMVYSAYADISNEAGGPLNAEVTDASSNNASTATQAQLYQRGFNLGLRHTF